MSAAVAGLDVSRETSERLEALAALVRKWNPTINLVSKASLDAIWTRHIADSAQLVRFCPKGARRWADLGSGGGFPGLVVAILMAERQPDLRLTLVESDGRKAAFLATAVRDCGLSARVLAERIEAVPPLQADVVSARALAPLSELLAYAERHLAPGGIALFPKGAGHAGEVAAALASWRFTAHNHRSTTDSAAVILEIRGLSRA